MKETESSSQKSLSLEYSFSEEETQETSLSETPAINIW